MVGCSSHRKLRDSGVYNVKPVVATTTTEGGFLGGREWRFLRRPGSS